MLAGFITGSIQTLVGHPFDTIKVSLLTATRPRHMYQGGAPALWSGCISNALVFGTEHQLHTLTSSHWQTGGLAGFLTGFIVHPMDYIKCRQQINQNIEWHQMMKGLSWTIGRDTIGYSIYFHTFHHYQDHMGTFCAGGMAGIGSWLLTYPLDVIKTQIQCRTNYQCHPSTLIKGLSVVLCRSFVVNALLFWCFEPIQKKLRGLVH